MSQHEVWWADRFSTRQCKGNSFTCDPRERLSCNRYTSKTTSNTTMRARTRVIEDKLTDRIMWRTVMLWRAHLLLRLHGLNTMELLHTYLHGLLNTRCNSAEVYDEGRKIGRRQQQLKAGIYSKVGPNTMSMAHATATRESKPKGEKIGASLCKTYMQTVENSKHPERGIGDEIVRTTLIIFEFKTPRILLFRKICTPRLIYLV